MATKEHIALLIETRNETIEKQNKIIDQLRSDREELLTLLKNVTIGITYDWNRYSKDYDNAVALINRIEKEKE